NKEQYNYDAWGEVADSTDVPSSENNIRYGGARMEFALNGDSNAVYECGKSHYWPAYGRFLQRDPLTYRKMPSPTVPLGVNPYLYAENNPVMKKDLSGMSAQWYRGVRMGDKSVYLGTRPPSNPNQIYDCCSEESPLLD
ncbi:MAG TPA: hypothetical protein ENN67_03040, partial [Firmicutes bacterium]|nr:hypothetical protein [Bacillota bacterium]